jgi:hypothetical protein
MIHHLFGLQSACQSFLAAGGGRTLQSRQTAVEKA